MKSLNTYINENNELNNLIIESCLNTKETETIKDVYESILHLLINEEGQINEGLFSKIGNKLKEWGEKTASTGEDLDKKVDKLSNDAKDAIDAAKKDVGDKWNSIKKEYIGIIAAIDQSMKATGESIADMAEKFKIKKEQLEATIAKVFANVIMSGTEIGRKIGEWLANSKEYATQIAACAALITGAKMAVSAGFSTSMILDLLDSAGVK